MADTKVIPAPRLASTLELPVRKESEAEEAANTRACSILASDNTDIRSSAGMQGSVSVLS